MEIRRNVPGYPERTSLTLAIRVFCRPTRSANRPMKTREKLFATLLAARRIDAEEPEYPSTEIAYLFK